MGQVLGQRINLHILHRNRLVRECLSSVLSGVPNSLVTPHDHAEIADWSGLEKDARHIALIDMQLPQGQAVSLIQQLTRLPVRVKVLVLVAVDDHEAIVNCVAAGASGCVLEEASLEELKTAIERVDRGETFCSPQLVSSMFQQLAALSRESVLNQRAGEVPLTPRERQILDLLADRLTNQEIADELSLSLYTVKNHVHNILEKLQVDDRFDAIEHAREHRLITKRRPAPAVTLRR